eukprot:scaffold15809_cov67-Isochrysis_galbana.AAC.1
MGSAAAFAFISMGSAVAAAALLIPAGNPTAALALRCDRRKLFPTTCQGATPTTQAILVRRAFRCHSRAIPGAAESDGRAIWGAGARKSRSSAGVREWGRRRRCNGDG